MFSYYLQSKHCSETGFNGIKVKGVSERDGHFPAYRARVLAHDIVEHPVRKLIGVSDIEDEFMALGASMFIRAWNEDIDDGIVQDISILLSHTDRVRQCPFAKYIKVSKVHYDMEWMIDLVKRGMRDADDMPDGVDGKHIISWLHCGYQYARNRFKGNNLKALDLFYEIEKRCEEMFQELKYGECERWTLSYNHDGNVFLKSHNLTDY